MSQPNPLLEKIIPAAEDLIVREHFSVENLCHAVDCSLKDLVGAMGSIDDLMAVINGRYMDRYIELLKGIDVEGKDDSEVLRKAAVAWLDLALENPKGMHGLLQHRWAEGYERPDWYLATVKACFAPFEKRLLKLAPKAKPEMAAGVARGLYAHICGLYFLSTNERAQPAGIDNLRKLLDLHVMILIKGLQGMQG